MQHSELLSLVHASRAGRADAFGRLVERYQSLAWAVAMSATGDAALSEEVAQEAFVAAWTRLPGLRDPASFPAWLCGIVRNLARYARRHQRRHAPASHAAEPGDAHLASLACPAPSPLDHAISRQEQRLLRDALGQIPETYRLPLILFYAEHQSLAQVAERLDLSEQTVKQRLCRGRKYLKKSVAERVAAGVARSAPKAGMGAAVLALLATRRAAASMASSMAPGMAASMAPGMASPAPAGLLGLIGTPVSLALASALAAFVVITAGLHDPAEPGQRRAPMVATPGPVSRPPAAPALPVPDAPRDHDTDTAAGPRAVVIMGPVHTARPTPHAARGTSHATVRPASRTVARIDPPRAQIQARPVAIPAVIEHGPSTVTRAPPQPSLSWHEFDGAMQPRARPRPARDLPIKPPDIGDRIRDIDL